MTTFYGFELELFATKEIGDAQGLRVHAATDGCGGQWLIVRVNDDQEQLAWICAPVSSRAVREVAAGRAAVRDVLRHSRTGTVEVVAVDQGRAVPDRCLLCSDIPASLLPAEDLRLALAA